MCLENLLYIIVCFEFARICPDEMTERRVLLKQFMQALLPAWEVTIERNCIKLQAATFWGLTVVLVFIRWNSAFRVNGFEKIDDLCCFLDLDRKSVV